MGKKKIEKIMKKMQTSTMQTNRINKYKTRLKHKYIVAKIQSNTEKT